jgi:hypothetical protein
MRGLSRLLRWAALILVGAAIYDQLRRPAAERTWHGRIGFVPYDFRPPTVERLRERLWNPNDPRIFTPHVWGVGWTINFYQLRHYVLPLVERVRAELSERRG